MKFDFFKLSVFIVGTLFVNSCVECYLSKFIRGRYFDKFKGLTSSPFPEQYFDQRLDHFNEALKTTWKQVKSYLFHFVRLPDRNY